MEEEALISHSLGVVGSCIHSNETMQASLLFFFPDSKMYASWVQSNGVVCRRKLELTCGKAQLIIHQGFLTFLLHQCPTICMTKPD
jgi:hypothetical protein